MSATKMWESFSNNKLIAGLIILALSLSLVGMRTTAANEAKQVATAVAVEKLSEASDDLKDFRARYEERERQRDKDVAEMKADIRSLLDRARNK